MQIEYTQKPVTFSYDLGDLIITKNDIPFLVIQDHTDNGHPIKLLNMNTARIHDYQCSSDNIKNVIKGKDLKLIVAK